MTRLIQLHEGGALAVPLLAWHVDQAVAGLVAPHPPLRLVTELQVGAVEPTQPRGGPAHRHPLSVAPRHEVVDEGSYSLRGS